LCGFDETAAIYDLFRCTFGFTTCRGGLLSAACRNLLRAAPFLFLKGRSGILALCAFDLGRRLRADLLYNLREFISYH